MSQYDFGTIDTATTDGVDLAALIENFRDAVHSMHSGVVPPSYATEGLLWLDKSATPWKITFHDGSDDIVLGEINPAAGTFKMYFGTESAGALAGKDTVGSDDIDANAVTTDKILDGAITSDKIQTDAVNSTHLDTADAVNMLSALGLGSVATKNTGAGGGDVPTNADLGAMAFQDSVNEGYVDSTGSDAGDVLTSNGAGGAAFLPLNLSAAGRLISMQIFTASGTWTKPSGCNAVKVTVVGGGGGGAAVANGDDAGDSGGTSSFGAHCSATGGSGGLGGYQLNSGALGGVGGMGSGGNINIGGGAGINGSSVAKASPNVGGAGGAGGNSIFGGGGRGMNASNSSYTAPEGKAPGAGGGGGWAGSSSSDSRGCGGGGAGGAAIKFITSGLGSTETVTVGAGGGGGYTIPQAGGNGAPGIVIVESYS